MVFLIEFLAILLAACCCLYVMTASVEEAASSDLQNLRETLSERIIAERGRQSAEVETTRMEKIKSKLFYKEMIDGESVHSVRSLISISKSARDLFQANNLSDSSRSVVSRSFRAAGASVRQFQRKKECSICLSGYEAGETFCWAKTDQCNHVFHDACIGEWLKDHDECPLCRADIVNADVVVVESSEENNGNENASSNNNAAEGEETGNENNTTGSNNNNTENDVEDGNATE
jgi:hypothetical protein